MKFNSKEAAQLTGVTIQEQSRLAARGLLRVTYGKKRNGCELHFDEVGILVLAVIRTLRKGGLSYSQIAPVARFVGSLDADELDEAAEQDLYIIGGGPLIPRFVTANTGVLNDCGENFLLVRIPTAMFWQRVKEATEALEAQAQD